MSTVVVPAIFRLPLESRLRGDGNPLVPRAGHDDPPPPPPLDTGFFSKSFNNLLDALRSFSTPSVLVSGITTLLTADTTSFKPFWRGFRSGASTFTFVSGTLITGASAINFWALTTFSTALTASPRLLSSGV